MSEDTKREGFLTSEEALNMLLGSGGLVCVIVDTRVSRVRVPKSLRGNPHVRFDLGLNLPVPIRDLEVTAQGWSATLSFNDGPYFCNVPWGAVLAMGMPDPSLESVDAQVKRKTLPPGWRVLDGGRKDSEPEDSGAA